MNKIFESVRSSFQFSKEIPTATILSGVYSISVAIFGALFTFRPDWSPSVFFKVYPTNKKKIEELSSSWNKHFFGTEFEKKDKLTQIYQEVKQALGQTEIDQITNEVDQDPKNKDLKTDQKNEIIMSRLISKQITKEIEQEAAYLQRKLITWSKNMGLKRSPKLSISSSLYRFYGSSEGGNSPKSTSEISLPLLHFSKTYAKIHHEAYDDATFKKERKFVVFRKMVEIQRQQNWIHLLLRHQSILTLPTSLFSIPAPVVIGICLVSIVAGVVFSNLYRYITEQTLDKTVGQMNKKICDVGIDLMKRVQTAREKRKADLEALVKVDPKTEEDKKKQEMAKTALENMKVWFSFCRTRPSLTKRITFLQNVKTAAFG